MRGYQKGGQTVNRGRGQPISSGASSLQPLDQEIYPHRSITNSIEHYFISGYEWGVEMLEADGKGNLALVDGQMPSFLQIGMRREQGSQPVAK